MTGRHLDQETAVRERYSGAASAREQDLCCPTSYDPGLLAAIPDEVLQRDYGCGNPAAHVRLGETVLDLGSGAGKACFMASQVVGPQGRVIGVDINDAMLALARRSAPEVARRTGHDNVTFKKGKIQDLSLDLEHVEKYLRSHPVATFDALSRLEAEIARFRRDAPLIADESVDVVVSNCVLNLVRPEDKSRLFEEIHRVLRRGGRAVISDIVSDEDIPEHLQRDPDLWSGCISGAFREDLFLRAFEDAGFYGIAVLDRQEVPWRTVDGIEFRSVTVSAYKGKEGPCLDQKHAVVYRGPFRQVVDDDGHVFRRGDRVAVCGKIYEILTRDPYVDNFNRIPPHAPVPLEGAPVFPCGHGALRRDPRETKGEDFKLTTEPKPSPCSADGGCC